MQKKEKEAINKRQIKESVVKDSCHIVLPYNTLGAAVVLPSRKWSSDRY